ncbi:PseG/SpsG family protein [Acidobacteriota bacterium]
MQKVIILTEGGENIGFGHVTRCLSLYQAFEKRGYLPELVVNGDDSIRGVLAYQRFQVGDWMKNPGKYVRPVEGKKIVIVDSYQARSDTYKKISSLAHIPVFLDDNGRIDYPAGTVINWNIYAKEIDYPKRDNISYLLGPGYISMRKAFWTVPEKVINKRVDRILITFGGDDSKNLTPGILHLLAKNYPTLEKTVVIGNAFTHLPEIKSAADQKTTLISCADDEKMKSLMLAADIAVTSGGQTLYELARTGCPAVVLAAADNQGRNVAGWHKTGFIRNAGSWHDRDLLKKVKKNVQELDSAEKRRLASGIGRAVIPGNGANQIIDFIEKRVAPAAHEGTGNPVPGRIDEKVCFFNKLSRSISKK